MFIELRISHVSGPIIDSFALKCRAYGLFSPHPPALRLCCMQTVGHHKKSVIAATTITDLRSLSMFCATWRFWMVSLVLLS